MARLIANDPGQEAQQRFCFQMTSNQSEKPVILPLGSDVLDWILETGPPTRLGLGGRFSLRWHSWWLENNLRLQRALPPAESDLADPIFILGMWRSGTTFLHRLMSSQPGMSFPATWQCMNPSMVRIRLAEQGGRKQVLRPMDNVIVASDSPQEDEFALLSLGVETVYRGFLNPQRLPELTRLLDPDVCRNCHEKRWQETWLSFLRGVSEGSPGRLVLKSPTHSFRIPVLQDCFPRASYVWLVRDPVDIYHSNLRMWSAMCRRYALFEWTTASLNEFLVAAFRYAAKSLRLVTSVCERQQLVVLSFDQLICEPLESVTAIARRLGLLDFDTSALSAMVAALKIERSMPANQGPTMLSDDDCELFRSVQKAALSTHGL